MIQPIYVTFEQAKKLKERGFDEKCLFYYLDKQLIQVISYENDIWCQNSRMPGNYLSAPEQWMVVEWLRVNHGIWVRLTTYAFGFQYHLDNTPDPETWNIDRRYDCADDFKTPQEAYSAAFDYILDNLIRLHFK
jgi:hypothetical protein